MGPPRSGVTHTPSTPQGRCARCSGGRTWAQPSSAQSSSSSRRWNAASPIVPSARRATSAGAALRSRRAPERIAVWQERRRRRHGAVRATLRENLLRTPQLERAVPDEGRRLGSRVRSGAAARPARRASTRARHTSRSTAPSSSSRRCRRSGRSVSPWSTSVPSTTPNAVTSIRSRYGTARSRRHRSGARARRQASRSRACRTTPRRPRRGREPHRGATRAVLGAAQGRTRFAPMGEPDSPKARRQRWTGLVHAGERLTEHLPPPALPVRRNMT